MKNVPKKPAWGLRESIAPAKDPRVNMDVLIMHST